MQEYPGKITWNVIIPFKDVYFEPIGRSCTLCEQEKPFEDFRYVPSRNVYNSQCRMCENAKRRTTYAEDSTTILERNNQWRQNNPEKVKESKKRDYEHNKEARLATSKAHKEANPEHYKNLDKARYVRLRKEIRLKQKTYYELNREWISAHRKQYRQANKNHIRKIARKSRNRNVDGKIAESLRKRVRSFLKTGKASSRLLGCTIDNIKQWFEFNFKIDAHIGMNWQNYGNVWEIDHVKPCKAHNMKLIEEVRRCFHWTNLAPIDKHHNRRKNKFRSEADERRQEERLKLFQDLQKQTLGTALTQ